MLKIKNTFNSEKLKVVKGDKTYYLLVNKGEIFEIEIDSKPLIITA